VQQVCDFHQINDSFPMQLEFSKGVPQICQLIRDFMSSFNLFARDFEHQQDVIHGLLNSSLDNILQHSVAGSMLSLLAHNNLSQAVQILINLIEFERASLQFEELLRINHFGPRDFHGNVNLQSVFVFRNVKGLCEKKVFELVVC
jgi:hypothetical protein